MLSKTAVLPGVEVLDVAASPAEVEGVALVQAKQDEVDVEVSRPSSSVAVNSAGVVPSQQTEVLISHLVDVEDQQL